MAQAPTPRFSSDQSQPVIIQNKMPKPGETDVTGQLGGGGGANNTFRLLGNTSTTPAATTSTSSNPYPVGYTSGIPQGYDTVSGPGASYNPETSSGGGKGTSVTTPNGSRVIRTGTSNQFPGLIEDTSPVNYGDLAPGTAIGAGGMPVQYGTNSTYSTGGANSTYTRPGGSNTTTGQTQGTQTGPYSNLGSSAVPFLGQRPAGIDQSSWSMFLATPAGQAYMAANGGGGGSTPPPATGGGNSQLPPWSGISGPQINPDLPIPGGGANAMYNKGGVTSGGNGSPYLGPPAGGGTSYPAQRPPVGGGAAQPNRDRFQGWHMGSGAWQSAPGRGPAAPTWMGGSYNPWTGQGGSGGTPPPPTGGGGQPPWIPSDPQTPGGGDYLRMMNSGTSTGPVVNPPIRPTSGGGGGGGFFTAGPGTTDAQTTGGFDPTANHPNYPGTGYGKNWTSGPYFQIPQGWNTAGPPGPSQQGGNYTPAGPDYTPPDKTEVGGNAVRVGVPRPNDQGAQRGWRYQQAGVPIYNDQLPPVGGNAAPAGSDMVAREPGYLGPPVHTGNYPPFPPFDPQNPPSPQQWLEIVRQWMAQYPREGNPNPWQGQAPSNPIQNPTWGAPWPGWQGGDLRNFPPSRPPGGTR